MHRMTMIVFAAIWIAVASSQAACFNNGQDLVNGWREHQKIMNNSPAERDYLSASRFTGYVTGVADALDTIMFDIPEGTTKDQIVAIVGKYLEANPDKWQFGGSVLVVNALKGAFPK